MIHTVKIQAKMEQDLSPFKHIKEQEKEYFDYFLETKTGKWSS
jgi:hypothetical protein